MTSRSYPAVASSMGALTSTVGPPAGCVKIDGMAASMVRQSRRHGRQHGASKSTVDMMMSIVSTIVSTEKPNDSASMGEKWT